MFPFIMGIQELFITDIQESSNFMSLAQSSSKVPEWFDSVLIDGQHYISEAINKHWEPKQNEDLFVQKVCQTVWNQVREVIDILLKFRRTAEECTVIFALDGEDVPMNWPYQRTQRFTSFYTSEREFYHFTLFGHNLIGKTVQTHLVNAFKEFLQCQTGFNQLNIIVSGCDMPGEGELKIFHIAKSKCCRHPIVVSEDHDVFAIALFRLEHFDSIQIYRQHFFYPISHIYRRKLEYPHASLMACLNLFGNKCIPLLFRIMRDNKAIVHYVLARDNLTRLGLPDWDEEKSKDYIPEDHPTYIVSRFLKSVNSIFFAFRESSRDLLVNFWIVYFWINDYYRKESFDQKYMSNPIFDAFDRQQLLSGLTILQESFNAYKKAFTIYSNTKTEINSQEEEREAVCTSWMLQKLLTPYLLPRCDEPSCVEIN